MEWSCARCGLTVTAEDWTLLASMGWRVIGSAEVRCVLCLRKEFERPRPAARERRELG